MNKRQQLSEAIKKHYRIVNYKGYLFEEEAGDMPPQDAAFEDDETQFPDFGSDQPKEVDASEIDVEELPEEPATNALTADDDVDTTEIVAPEPEVDMDGTVEVDITELINTNKNITTTLDSVSKKTGELSAFISNMEQKLNSMDQVLNRIDHLEGMIKEVLPPSEEEHRELISLNSYPYNTRVDQFWKQKQEQNPRQTEYVLTKDDVDNIDLGTIKNSFGSLGNEEPGRFEKKFYESVKRKRKI